MEPANKKWKTEKVKSKQTDMLRSIGKQPEKSVKSALKKKGRYDGKDLEKKEGFKSGMTD